MEERLAALEKEIADMRQTMNQLVGLLEAIKSEVEPTIQALMENPMVKMMMGGH